MIWKYFILFSDVFSSGNNTSGYVLYKFTGNVNSDIEKGFYEGNIPQFSPWIAVKMWPLDDQDTLTITINKSIMQNGDY